MTFCWSINPQASHSKRKCVPRGQGLKRIPAWNVEKVCRDYVGVKRGGETDQQNVIMQKAYLPSKVTYDTFFGVFTLDFLLSKT